MTIGERQRGAPVTLNVRPPKIAMPTLLAGQWFVRDGTLAADDVCVEIDALLENHLDEVAHDASGWLTLYRDRRDGQYWELSYPQSHMHGGGPPKLVTITPADARLRMGRRWPNPTVNRTRRYAA